MTKAAKFQYEGWTRTEYLDKTVWVATYEVACHFQLKASLHMQMVALRSLNKTVFNHRVNDLYPEVDPETRNMLDYIKLQMIEVSKKVRAANRKMEKNGWFYVSDAMMNEAIAHYKGEAA